MGTHLSFIYIFIITINFMSFTILSNLQSSNKNTSFIYDRVIRALIEKREQSEWRRMIAFSKKWKYLAQGVFIRLDDLEKAHKHKPLIVTKLENTRKKLYVLHNELN